MAFKINNFYGGSPLHRHHGKVVKDPKGDPVTIVKGKTSANRDLTESEIRRRKKKLDKLNSKETLSKRRQRKKIKIEDQLERGQDGESDKATQKMVDSGLYMKEDQENKSLNPGAVKNVMKNKSVSEKEAIAIVNKRRSESKSNAKKKQESKSGWSTEKCQSKRAELKKVLAKDPYAEFGSILKEQLRKNCK